jgi:dsDNA-specific endonuclease/ATPase MutS2
MDVLQLIDKLEQLVNSGTRLPLSSRTVIDEQEFLDIIDQLRIMVPDEIKQARRVSSERDRVMQDAEAAAEKIIGEAEERVRLMLDDSEITRLADQTARQIVNEAEAKAEQIRRGADEYALEVLSGLENEMTKLLVTVRKGRATLDRSSHRSAEFATSPE